MDSADLEQLGVEVLFLSRESILSSVADFVSRLTCKPASQIARIHWDRFRASYGSRILALRFE